MEAGTKGRAGSRRAGAFATLVVALAFGVLVAGASPAQAAPPPRDVAIGDSITWELATDGNLKQKFLDAGWDWGYVGLWGHRIDQIRPSIQYSAGYTPQLRRMFLNIGANDASKYRDDTSWQLSWSVNELHAAVHDVIDIRPNACVLLVTLTKKPGETGRRATAVNTLNTHIKQIDAAFANVHVIDWAHFAAADPARYVDTDGIHTTPAGAEYLANLYRWFGTTLC
jgi:hypothetical protein